MYLFTFSFKERFATDTFKFVCAKILYGQKQICNFPALFKRFKSYDEKMTSQDLTRKKNMVIWIEKTQTNAVVPNNNIIIRPLL